MSFARMYPLIWSAAANYIRARLPALLLAASLATPLSALAASPFAEAAADLDGEWRSADFVLKIDSKRAQASLDPARPFEWRRFLVKDISGGTVTFAVGPDLFEATLADDELRLTGTSFRGEQMLRRQEPVAVETERPSTIEPGFRGSGD